MVQIQRDVRWNAGHWVATPCVPGQSRRSRLDCWSIASVVMLSTGVALEQFGEGLTRFESWVYVAGAIGMFSWTAVVLPLWFLGLRSGWAVQDDGRVLVLQGPVKRRSVKFQEIASIELFTEQRKWSDWVLIEFRSGRRALVVGMIPARDLALVHSYLRSCSA